MAAAWITPCFRATPQCTNPKLFNFFSKPGGRFSSCSSLSWKRSRTRSCVSQRTDNQQEDNAFLSQDDISYLFKLGAGCTVVAATIKYGSILFPMITQPNILQALVMISAPVVISVLILIKESLTENKGEDLM
ncbi:hypothetical protein J5N97_027121 [Dioscorea zingiberensis]|uniref:Uncharacterized protein n=1 Tax=Dioscorea zingiberensis TaxID=325984 RepID=A0A9D5C4B5_9LILI|nr:hypothetical protein J5N97_027121 [Dioscorea zingiberensis]